MSPQEIFDTVVKHLRKQNARSTFCRDTIDVCAYRGINGTKCAVGCLIPDDVYDISMEGVGVYGIVYNNKLQFLANNIELCRDLQHIHDSISIMEWEDMFQRVSISHNLIYTAKE